MSIPTRAFIRLCAGWESLAQPSRRKGYKHKPRGVPSSMIGGDAAGRAGWRANSDRFRSSGRNRRHCEPGRGSRLWSGSPGEGAGSPNHQRERLSGSGRAQPAPYCGENVVHHNTAHLMGEVWDGRVLTTRRGSRERSGRSGVQGEAPGLLLRSALNRVS